MWFIYRLLSWTWRLELVEPPEMMEALEKRAPFILAHWHGDEIPLVQLSRRYRIATMTSNSKDGSMMTVIVKLMGGKTSRGSSSRGGAAGLKGLVRLLSQGHTTSFAVDGPKGPYHKVKPGILEMSRLSKAPIYVGGLACDNAWIFHKAWNKAFLPKPFSRVVILWQFAMPAIDKSMDPRSPELGLSLEQELTKAGQNAAKRLAEISKS